MPMQMTEEVFRRFSELIRRECGIDLSVTKKVLLEGRIRKRLRHLGIPSFERYLELVLNGGGRERIALIDVVTTNKTDFLREPQQFEYLVKHVLPEYARLRGRGGGPSFRVWSAACSSGEEPYTLAMILSEYGAVNPGFDFSILASDISTQILEQARNAIYEHSQVDPLPLEWRKKYLLRSCKPEHDLVRICPELREKVRFERLNLMDENHGIREPMDAIFCRNVIIYFDRPTQERVVRNLTRRLAPGGFLFMGHSETLNKMKSDLNYVAANIYRKTPATGDSEKRYGFSRVS